MNVAVVPGTSSAIGPVRPPVNDPPYTLRDLLTAAFYHRRIMVIAFLLPVLLAIAAARVTRPAYVAQAQLLVLYGREYFYRPEQSQGGYSVALDRSEIMTGELQVLHSTPLAVQTLQTLGVDRVYPGTRAGDERALDGAVRRLSKDLNLTVIPQSSIMELSFRSHDPDVAQAVLRTLIEAYLQRRKAIFERAPTTTAQADQAAFRDRLYAAEDALAHFANAHGIANIDQQIALLLQQQAANRQTVRDTQQAVSETTARLAAVQAQLAQLPPTIRAYAESDRSQTAQLLTESLLRLQIKRRDLVSRYQDDVPQVQDLDRQIASVQAQIAQAPTRDGAIARSGVNPVYQEAEGQAIALRAQRAGLQAKLEQATATSAAIDAEVVDLNKAARDYRDLQRNRDLLENAYNTLMRSNEDAQIADTAERGRAANVRVVQPPERPASGVDLRRILLAGGVAVGVLASVAALAVANALRQVFISVRDARTGLQLPVVLAVSRAARRKLSRRQAGCGADQGGPDRPAPEPRFLDIGGASRLVAILLRERGTATIVQLIAASARQGTSSVARDLALVAARIPGVRVLLLDLDPQGNSQLEALRAGFGCSIASTRSLAGSGDAASGNVLVHQLAIGTLPGHLHVTEIRAQAWAGADVWGRLLPALRAEFDLVLIDSPSIGRSHDGTLLAPDVDTTLLVVAAERAKSAVVRDLRDRILDLGGRIGGVVLNQRRFHIPEFIYRHV